MRILSTGIRKSVTLAPTNEDLLDNIPMLWGRQSDWFSNQCWHYPLTLGGGGYCPRLNLGEKSCPLDFPLGFLLKMIVFEWFSTKNHRRKCKKGWKIVRLRRAKNKYFGGLKPDFSGFFGLYWYVGDFPPIYIRSRRKKLPPSPPKFETNENTVSNVSGNVSFKREFALLWSSDFRFATYNSRASKSQIPALFFIF